MPYSHQKHANEPSVLLARSLSFADLMQCHTHMGTAGHDGSSRKHLCSGFLPIPKWLRAEDLSDVVFGIPDV